MQLIKVTLMKPYTQYGVDYKAGDKIFIRESKVLSFVESGLIEEPNKTASKKNSAKK